MQAKTNTPESGNGQADDSSPSTSLTPQDSMSIPGEVRNFVADIGDLLKATTLLTGDDLARARTRLIERAAAARASLERMGSAIGDRARQTARATDGYVHEQPWQAIGIGAVVGLVLGIVLARRRG